MNPTSGGRQKRRGDGALHAYVTAVSALGFAALGLLLFGLEAPAKLHWGHVLVLAACTIVGELKPVPLTWRQSRGSGGAITISTAFAFALLLLSGGAAAAVSLALASVISDVYMRRSWYKALYNVGQYILSLSAAALTVLALTGEPALLADGLVHGDDVVPLVAASLAFFLVNNSLVGTVIALAQHRAVPTMLVREFAEQGPTDALLFAMAPVVVVVAASTLGLMPLLLLPVAAIYMGANASKEKEHQALHDSLTGLPNRTGFRDAVADDLREAGRTISAVMIIDLDRFKEINDTLGHHLGDLLLKEVGPRLAEAVRGADFVARFGGDEFGIFLPDIGSEEKAVEVAGRVRAAIAHPFIVEDLLLHIEGSIGIALTPDHGEDVDTLLQRADVAMYTAKETHSGYRLYTPDRDPHSRRRLTLLSDQRSAIDRHELVLHFQPKADAVTGRVTDVEALVRWMHPEMGLVPPNDFIPLAERSGLIGPLTDYVLDHAVSTIAAWRAEGIDLRVAVNLSVRSLMDLELPERIAALLARADVPATALALEITESTIMGDPVRALRVLQPLADMGIRLSIDDFGTGYSSLAYLRQLPISEIKIDRSFVTNMITDENDAVIVRSTIEMAKNLGLEIVAEGVETAEVASALAALGCDYIQGYLLSKPLPAEELLPRLGEIAGVVGDPASASSQHK